MFSHFPDPGPGSADSDQVGPEEAEISSALGRALFAVYGTDVPPDATFSLRIADGVVEDYEYNGTIAPINTTFYGMYDHYYSYGAGSDWDLPDRWLSPPSTFDLSTPLNFVSSADIIGGNSGSPVIDQNLQVVGLIFDGNIESLPGDYIYLPEENRSVSVDVRGILEALDEIYQADRMVQELLAGQVAGADARGVGTSGRHFRGSWKEPVQKEGRPLRGSAPLLTSLTLPPPSLESGPLLVTGF